MCKRALSLGESRFLVGKYRIGIYALIQIDSKKTNVVTFAIVKKPTRKLEFRIHDLVRGLF